MHYSLRNAIVGSIRVARTAGNSAASVHATNTQLSGAATFQMSEGSTPNNPAVTKRANPEAVHAGGVADYGAKVPLGLGHVDDAAAAAVFLAGDLSRFVKGTTIHLDGGTFAASGWHKGPSGNYEP